MDSGGGAGVLCTGEMSGVGWGGVDLLCAGGEMSGVEWGRCTVHRSSDYSSQKCYFLYSLL